MSKSSVSENRVRICTAKQRIELDLSYFPKLEFGSTPIAFKDTRAQ